MDKVTKFAFSNIDFSWAYNMSHMFDGCSSLTSLDISSFNTSNVTDMSYMFTDCPFWKIDLSRLNTSRVTNMSHMFQNTGLESVDISGFDFSNVTDVSYMFENCRELRELNVGGNDFTFSCNTESLFEDVGWGDPCRLIINEDFDTRELGDPYIDAGNIVYDWHDGVFTLDELANDEKKDYSATIKKYNNKLADVYSLRSFAKDRVNTICLPYDVSYSDLKSIFGSDVKLYQPKDMKLQNNRITYAMSDCTSGGIKAGTPYFLTISQTITNPWMNGRTIQTEIANPQSADVTDGTVEFIGTSFPKELTNNDKSILFLKNGKLYYPSVTDGDCRIYGMRAYFKISTPASAKPNRFEITNPDGSVTAGVIGEASTTDIDDVGAVPHKAAQEATYNLAGQRVNSSYKGVVIRGGKKYIQK